MTSPPDMRRIVEIADPIGRQIAEDFKGTTEPLRVWAEHAGALALLFATLLEPLDAANEAAAREAFAAALAAFLTTLRTTPKP